MVNSLKSEYKDQIEFREINLQTPEGASFGRKHGVGKVTLVFFAPDGERLAILPGLRSADFLRTALDRAFNLKKD